MVYVSITRQNEVGGFYSEATYREVKRYSEDEEIETIFGLLCCLGE